MGEPYLSHHRRNHVAEAVAVHVSERSPTAARRDQLPSGTLLQAYAANAGNHQGIGTCVAVVKGRCASCGH